MLANPELPFSQIIADAQDQALQLHVEFEDQFDELRSVVSQHLTAISESTLTILLDATEETRQQSMRCIGTPSVGIQITQLSAQLSQCALETDQAITTLSSAYFDALVRPQGASVALLSAVLDYVGRSNPVDSPNQIATDMANALQTLRDEFANEMLPAVQRTVDGIEEGILGVPQITRDCVDKMLIEIELVASRCT